MKTVKRNKQGEITHVREGNNFVPKPKQSTPKFVVDTLKIAQVNENALTEVLSTELRLLSEFKDTGTLNEVLLSPLSLQERIDEYPDTFSVGEIKEARAIIAECNKIGASYIQLIKL